MSFHYPDHGLAMDATSAAVAAASSLNPSFSPGGGGGEREKAAITSHPLYEWLLEAHVACLRVATPVDQLPRIDAQIAARLPPLAVAAGGTSGGEELDLFMVECSNPSLLSEPGKRRSTEEPYVKIEMLTPKDYISPIMELAQDRRGEFKEMNYITENRAKLMYELPLAEDPIEVSGFHEKVVEISAGNHHSCAVTADGELFVWGKNSCGQLGLGQSTGKVVSTPRKVDYLADFKVKMVALVRAFHCRYR